MNRFRIFFIGLFVAFLAVFIFCQKAATTTNTCIFVDDISKYESSLDKLSFKTDGNIAFIPYSKGDYIKKGQVIARLDGLLCRLDKTNVCDCIILAPYSGYIVEKYHNKDDYVKANTPVVALSALNYCAVNKVTNKKALKNPS